jgi:hypothetical protein
MKDKITDCGWYWDGFCCKDLDSGRVWDCTAPGGRKKKIAIVDSNAIK